MTALPYRPEIDGLRAIAVVPVVLFHLNLAWLPGGIRLMGHIENRDKIESS